MVMDSIICVFGDSTAWGAWDKEKGGWVNRLWLYCAEKANDENLTEIYNLSISGGTTETILARFENEARVRHADALIFQTGANDSSDKNIPRCHAIKCLMNRDGRCFISFFRYFDIMFVFSI